MAQCGYCGRTIAFGGVRDGGRRFCNKTCRSNAILAAASAQLPDGFVAEKAIEIHTGLCPKCGGEGPVDVHTSHTVWSAGIITRRSYKSEFCCQSCGQNAKLRAAVFSGLLGWWGFPWGFIWTPAQLIRNIGGLFSTPDPARPSDKMVNMVRAGLSAKLMEEERVGAETARR